MGQYFSQPIHDNSKDKNSHRRRQTVSSHTRSPPIYVPSSYEAVHAARRGIIHDFEYTDNTSRPLGQPGRPPFDDPVYIAERPNPAFDYHTRRGEITFVTSSLVQRDARVPLPERQSGDTRSVSAPQFSGGSSDDGGGSGSGSGSGDSGGTELFNHFPDHTRQHPRFHEAVRAAEMVWRYGKGDPRAAPYHGVLREVVGDIMGEEEEEESLGR